MTQVIKSISDYISLKKTFDHKTIGLTPTMGALHEGHLTLLKKSKLENDITICSIFVNPTQFNKKEDLDKYPQTFEQDLKKLSSISVDYLFYPTFDDIYPDNYKYKVSESDFSKNLCGKFRPGHFDGVLTVVMKLFNIIKPTNAYFGEKDFQQYKLISGMAEAFFMDVNVVPVATVREKSGLAMSSRNLRLSADGLRKAEVFAKILTDTNTLEETIKKFENENIEIEYLEEHFGKKFAAVNIDGVRLIDNV